MPFFGLDMDVQEPIVLDELCRQGIFRKYERVLIVSCGLGGAARWWAARWGCTVIGTDARAGFVSGADLLSRRAGVHGQTTFATAHDSAVPLCAGCVTHTWIRDLGSATGLGPLLREAHDALRPGGHLTVDTTELDIVAPLAAAADEAGFIALETKPVASVSPPHALLTALSRLEAFLRRTTDDPVGSALQALVAARRAAVQDSKPRAQFFAQRPS
jgi:SAM-dependent methyltransferase